MSRWLATGTTVAVLFVSAYRMWALTTAPQSPADLSAQRQAVVRWLTSSRSLSPRSDGSIDAALLSSELRELGISSLQLQRFDPEALVVIVPGADGRPGVAGVDDNGDALVDNRFELGATDSDDRCEVLTPQQHGALAEITLVLQRGAFLPATTALSWEHDTEQQIIVRGQDDGEPWSFVVRPANPK